MHIYCFLNNDVYEFCCKFQDKTYILALEAIYITKFEDRNIHLVEA